MTTATILALVPWSMFGLWGQRAAPAGLPLAVSNITVSQQTNCSKQVNVSYNLVDAEGSTRTVSVVASSDGGAALTVPESNVNGAVGSGISPIANKLIVPDSRVDPRQFCGGLNVLVCADDGRVLSAPSDVLRFPCLHNSAAKTVREEPEENR